ncbi:hypothetical protein OSCI_2940006 [Kamptonema sp. PCC 6506]|nr:hypothetical protein OSCI_2940006 [Kamptonema sp. PCC 6506]
MTPNWVATFLIDIFPTKYGVTIFSLRASEYAFIRFDYTDISLFLIAPHNSGNRCKFHFLRLNIRL